MVNMEKMESHEAWLEKRRGFIGGSDASSIMGENPWKTNVDLWLEKTGRKEPADLSNNELVNYGAAAERYQRELFKLDYPLYEVYYIENNIWFNDNYPWAHASLDGWIKDRDGKNGIFECKTATLANYAQRRRWGKDSFPNYYYWQVLHYMLVMDADFAILRAQLKEQNENEEVSAIIKHYRITRDDAELDMYRLLKAEREFYECIVHDREPALKLPFAL